MHLVAIGSMSGSVTVWCSNSMKAVAIINGLLGSVTDISWSPTGESLLVALENMGILYIKLNIASLNLAKSDTLNTLKKAVVASFQLPENKAGSITDQPVTILNVRKRVAPTAVEPITDNKDTAAKKACTDGNKLKETDKSDNLATSEKAKSLEKTKELTKVEVSKKSKVKEVTKKLIENEMDIDDIKDSLDEDDDHNSIPFSNRISPFYLADPEYLPDDYVCYSELNTNESNSSPVFSLRINTREPSAISRNCVSIRCFEEPSSKSHGSLLWQDELNLKVKLAAISNKFAAV